MITQAFAADKVHAAFYERPLEWGVTDCAQMAIALAREIGAHVPEFAPYRSQNQARRRLKSFGVNTLDEYLDLHYKKILPAQSLPGDILGLPANEGTVFGSSLGMVVNSVHCMAINPATGKWDHCERTIATAAWRLTDG